MMLHAYHTLHYWIGNFHTCTCTPRLKCFNDQGPVYMYVVCDCTVAVQHPFVVQPLEHFKSLLILEV